MEFQKCLSVRKVLTILRKLKNPMLLHCPLHSGEQTAMEFIAGYKEIYMYPFVFQMSIITSNVSVHVNLWKRLLVPDLLKDTEFSSGFVTH